MYNVLFKDANINVGLPIFTIHGNHDDTAGKVNFLCSFSDNLEEYNSCNWRQRRFFQGLTILDVLHEAGLVNLFGKFSDIDQFDVS